MEFLRFFIREQIKIDARNQKTQQTKQALISGIKFQLKEANNSNNEQTEVELTFQLGNAYAYYADFDLADTMYRQGLAIARQIPDKNLETIGLVNLGLSNKERLNYKEAYSYYQKALRISREINNKNLEQQIEGYINELANMLDIEKLSKE